MGDPAWLSPGSRAWTGKLADFGETVKDAFGKEGTVGTPEWMAPEVMDGGKYSQAADVFSTAVVVWECLTEMIPYDEECHGDPDAVIDLVLRGERPDASSLTPPLQAALTASWCQDASQRASLFELKQAVLGEAALSPRSYPPGEMEVGVCAVDEEVVQGIV